MWETLTGTGRQVQWALVLRESVTRAAVRAGFEQFVEDAVEATAEHFDVARALRQGIDGPGASVVDRLLNDSEAVRRRVVEPELAIYRRRTIDQFDVILDYAESEAGIEEFRESILERDAFAEEIRDDVSPKRRRAIVEDLLERHRKLGEAAVPLIESSEEDFWDAVQTTLDRETAKRLVEKRFVITGPIRDHTDAIAMTTTIDPGDVLGGLGGLLGGRLPTLSVEYTDEAVRAMRQAEQTVITDAKREIDRRFGSSEGV